MNINKNLFSTQNSINNTKKAIGNNLSFSGGAAAATIIYNSASESSRRQRDEYEREQNRYRERLREEQREQHRYQEHQRQMSELRDAREREDFNELKATYIEENIIPALEKLNKKLYKKIETEFDGNKLTLRCEDEEGVVDIPEDFLDKNLTDIEKELIVKSWLYEAKRFHDFDNIPVELLECANRLGFNSYDDSGVINSFIYADKRAKENGINVRQFIDKGDYNRELHLEVDDVPFVINLKGRTSLGHFDAYKRADFIYGASYTKEQLNKEHEIGFSGSELAGMILYNIKDSMTGRFITENGKDVFVPNLNKGVPNIEDKTLLKNGNAEVLFYRKPYICDVFKKAGIDIDEDNLKQIDYTETFTDKKQAYSYFDKKHDTYYLYLSRHDAEQGDIIIKEDMYGDQYQMEFPYCNGYVNSNKYRKLSWKLL